MPKYGNEKYSFDLHVCIIYSRRQKQINRINSAFFMSDIFLYVHLLYWSKLYVFVFQFLLMVGNIINKVICN